MNTLSDEIYKTINKKTDTIIKKTILYIILEGKGTNAKFTDSTKINVNDLDLFINVNTQSMIKFITENNDEIKKLNADDGNIDTGGIVFNLLDEFDIIKYKLFPILSSLTEETNNFISYELYLNFLKDIAKLL